MQETLCYTIIVNIIDGLLTYILEGSGVTGQNLLKCKFHTTIRKFPD